MRKNALANQRLGVAAALDQHGHQRPRAGRRDAAVFHERDQLRERLRRELRGVDLAVAFLQLCEHVAQHPVRDGLRLAATRRRRLVEIRERAALGEQARVVRREPVLALEARAALLG